MDTLKCTKMCQNFANVPFRLSPTDHSECKSPVVDARNEYGVDGEGDAGDVEGEEALEDGVRVAADGVVGRAQEGAHLQCTQYGLCGTPSNLCYSR